jgi:ABC-2 type transport system permease protein
MGAWVITLKDLRLIAQDRGALFTLLALPIVFIAILGMSTGQMLSQRDDVKLINIGFVDEDQTELSEAIFDNLHSIGGLKVSKVRNHVEALRELQDGRNGLAITIGKDFHNRVEDLDMGDVLDARHGKLEHGLSSLDIQVDCGAAYVSVEDMVKYVAFAAVMQSVAPAVTRRSSLFSRVVDQMIERHKQEASEGGNANPGTAEPVKRTTNIIYQTLVPAFMVLFAFFLVNIMASSFIGERDRGTLRRMQATRVTPVQLLTGKTLPFLLVSVVQSVLLFLSGKLMFGMSWGTHPAMLLPVILTTSFAATGLGLLVATFVRTESQVSSYSTFLVVVLAGISGCYMPRDWLPEIMKNISLATPHAWALIGYQELLTREQPNLQLVAKCCGILTAMGGACFAFGCVRFRRFEYPV